MQFFGFEGKGRSENRRVDITACHCHEARLRPWDGEEGDRFWIDPPSFKRIQEEKLIHLTASHEANGLAHQVLRLFDRFRLSDNAHRGSVRRSRNDNNIAPSQICLYRGDAGTL